MRSYKSSREFSERKHEAGRFIKERLHVPEVFKFTAERFRQIYNLLLKVSINKHDQGHQYRVGLNTVVLMEMLGYDKEVQAVSALSALIHDIGYNRKDPPDHNNIDPAAAGKTSFKKHAAYGADEAKRWLELLGKMKESERNISTLPSNAQAQGVSLDDLITIKDENKNWRTLNKEDILQIYNQILHHNHYGMEGREFDPGEAGAVGLMVRFGDKIDVCRQRVYDEHVKDPNVFIEGDDSFDPFYFHRCVPYSTLGYEFDMPEDCSSVTIRYYVDLDDFNVLMSGVEGYEGYTQEDYRKDFLRAYKKSFEIVSESLAVILGEGAAENNLRIEFVCEQGEIEPMEFSSPEKMAA